MSIRAMFISNTISYLITCVDFREDPNVVSVVGGGGGSGGAFTRWLREFRRETYKVNTTNGGVGGNCGNGGTYHTTAEDGRRRHSFNAHDKHAHQAAPRLGSSHVAPASRAPCRRANSTAAPKSRYVSKSVII